MHQKKNCRIFYVAGFTPNDINLKISTLNFHIFLWWKKGTFLSNDWMQNEHRSWYLHCAAHLFALYTIENHSRVFTSVDSSRVSVLRYNHCSFLLFKIWNIGNRMRRAEILIKAYLTNTDYPTFQFHPVSIFEKWVITNVHCNALSTANTKSNGK